MEYKEYLAKQKKSEKGRMKKRLLEWGGALDLCGRKQEELRRVEKLHEEQRRIWGGNKTAAGRRVMEQLEERYAAELAAIEAQISEILRRKAETDRLMAGLSPEEMTFLILRFEKGFGFDYIGIKMHMSRATIFRVQERVLLQLLEEEKKIETF